MECKYIYYEVKKGNLLKATEVMLNVMALHFLIALTSMNVTVNIKSTISS